MNLNLSKVLLCLWMYTFTMSVAAKEERIQFTSGDITLKGSLLLPKGEGPFPAVIFLHGSGAETRKNSKERAKKFVKQGYAALIFDKRASGESGGDPRENQYFKIDNLVNDGLAALDFLSKRKEIQAADIGIFAPSQAGWIAPLVASRSKSIAFMIMLSTSVCSIEEDRLFERAERLKKLGISASSLEEVKEMQLAEGEKKRGKEDAFTRLWNVYKERSWFRDVYRADRPEVYDDYRNWYSDIAQHTAIPQLQELEIPILWIFGDPQIDLLGPVNKSIDNLKRLRDQGKDYKILEYPGADHNLRGANFEKEMFLWLKESRHLK